MHLHTRMPKTPGVPSTQYSYKMIIYTDYGGDFDVIDCTTTKTVPIGIIHMCCTGRNINMYTCVLYIYVYTGIMFRAQ